jgi:hypothetical protein
MGNFPETRWSLVAAALESGVGTVAGTHQRQALDELCRLYWYPRAGAYGPRPARYTFFPVRPSRHLLPSLSRPYLEGSRSIVAGFRRGFCDKGLTRIVKLLMSKDVDPESMDAHGLIPIELDWRHDHTRRAELFARRPSVLPFEPGLRRAIQFEALGKTGRNSL